MRVYTVHLPAMAGENAKDMAAEAVLVKEGFCWPAFFLAPIWALWHRMWLFCVFVLAGGAAVTAVGDLLALAPAGIGALEIGFLVWVGAEANDWRRRSLDRRGHRLAGIATGRDLAAAERRLFDLDLLDLGGGSAA